MIIDEKEFTHGRKFLFTIHGSRKNYRGVVSRLSKKNFHLCTDCKGLNGDQPKDTLGFLYGWVYSVSFSNEKMNLGLLETFVFLEDRHPILPYL